LLNKGENEMTQTQLARMDTAALNKALIGFDRIFNTMERNWANSVNNNYPPYNLERKGEVYTITLAVAGFERNEIDISVDQDQLIISGEKTANAYDEGFETLHRGLALRGFERRFALSEHMEVKSAEIKNGLLAVVIERIIPEALLPRKIQIKEA
jgi:molecular chaperone IbpA